ncbi:MAG TPA: Gfo/Idh/MocA family oxidoreductase [Tepidisphaeraceae bacterium]|nr:Gfo/Idh/MocA family oxidoreductase [Tepidisphaeraceae bacterium]
MKTIRFGVIGGGLMGKEFASSAARWAHLLDMPARPEIVAIASGREATFGWFKNNFPAIKQYATDYRELLKNDQVDAVYIAVPHHLHQAMYCATIEAGKHLMGEKPFGIDQNANRAILDCIAKHPNVLVRCSSEFPFFPAVQRIGEMIEKNAFGKIIEVSSGFLHSSDLDPNKPINWKRQVEFNGEYGVMGDLGMHVCHVPFRAGWKPRDVRAVLSNIITERPDGKGGRAICSTWDNATLLCSSVDNFPITFKTQRVAPGQKNTWIIEVLGTQSSARWSTANPKLLELLNYTGGEQIWQHVQTGYDPAFKTITGPIFEFGFTDAMLQMWAGFVYELAQGKPLKRFAQCVTPEETALSHKLFTAALESQKNATTVSIK